MDLMRGPNRGRTGTVAALRTPVVGSTSASPSCSVISTAVRAAFDSRGPLAKDARPSSSDEGCGAGSSCRVAASGARAPISQSASSMVSLCGQYDSVRCICKFS